MRRNVKSIYCMYVEDDDGGDKGGDSPSSFCCSSCSYFVFLFLPSAMMRDACLFLFFLLFVPLCFGSFLPLPDLDSRKGEVVRR